MDQERLTTLQIIKNLFQTLGLFADYLDLSNLSGDFGTAGIDLFAD